MFIMLASGGTEQWSIAPSYDAGDRIEKKSDICK